MFGRSKGALVSGDGTSAIVGVERWLGDLSTFGSAGKVEYGPSCTLRLPGGLPRSFVLAEGLLLGHADDTAGPCFRRDRDRDVGVMADLGSSTAMFVGPEVLVSIADIG